MDIDSRPFESVNVGLTNVEAGKDRFTSHGMFHPPPIAYWRNNLTALSQRYNLYFVATRNSIVVYKPEFPFQELRRMPCLVILPTLANPEAQGYIDPHSPHDIDHLMVGDLGTEEILLLATDSGNVTAYYTKSLEAAINRAPPLRPHPRSDHLGVRAFFAQWVCESAWGLSIHTHARMIAVSANTSYHVQSGDPCSKVTVFAFALTQEGQTDGDDDDDDAMDAGFEAGEHSRQPDWHEWEGNGSDDFLPPRDRNYKITLGGIDGHDYNIPSISFVNTGQDLEGKWLLSTDIGGMMKMWQIWQGRCIKTWDLAERRTRSAFFRRPEGGWLVAALDPRAFRLAETMDEFCGHSRAPQYHGHVGESYDITHIVRVRTPGHSATFPRLDGHPEEESADEENLEPLISWSDMDRSDVEDDETTLNEFSTLVGHRDPTESFSDTSIDNSESDAANGPTVAGEVPTASLEEGSDRDMSSPTTGEAESSSTDIVQPQDFPSDLDASEGAESSSHSHSEAAGQSEPAGQSSSLRPSNVTSRHSRYTDDDASGVDVDSSLQGQASWTAQLKRNSKANAWDVRKVRADTTPPPIPVLHCSASNLRLIIAPEADSAHLFCANILKQVLPQEIEQTRHAHLDRLNMMQAIPELGVVIIASQLGRCAVCSLTKNQKSGTLGLRVDWTLPTQKQEARRLRPFLPLLGMATSPIQGHLKSEDDTAGYPDDSPVEWGSDGAVDGVPTTFDPTVIVVRECEIPESDQHHQRADRETDHDSDHQLKRKRPSYDSDTESGSKVSIETSRWDTPSSRESWQTTESSRRYRLMLTYMDMTVLTYEISRGVERHDIDQEETSTLDMVD
ncbi:hypothetical protein A1O1_07323 [Capronia coronata CBS 617.96]|uniref:Uncharacterized protein n=1 Tax=Capronia coronata CBS 617.96 TaxID=1182541 RepID=W9YN54_9EURO|nr:uncharacterized protein A1O1_07323 [Capronia coronata CBS 617.96]EXJ83699.1 hypothetical protein A1O1_07323 [Capronia coronata CBS 617.96]